jgi:hypothetical protein
MMTIQFTNAIKAQITQSLIKTLFERAGYRVTRLGVEELFSEITYLDEAGYKALNLPLALRYLPDLLVADGDLTRAFLVEVKFRTTFDAKTMEDLYKELTRQREYWPDSHAIVLIARPFVPEGRFHQDCIRVIPPVGPNDDTDYLEYLNPLRGKLASRNPRLAEAFLQGGCQMIWGFLPMLTHFDKVGQRDLSGENADLITQTIKDPAGSRCRVSS